MHSMRKGISSQRQIDDTYANTHRSVIFLSQVKYKILKPIETEEINDTINNFIRGQTDQPSTNLT